VFVSGKYCQVFTVSEKVDWIIKFCVALPYIYPFYYVVFGTIEMENMICTEQIKHCSTQHFFKLSENFCIQSTSKGKAVPFKGLGWPREFQEVKVRRFLDNGTGWW
jgi:hypothetical protein